mgnify:CR=1 FL=1
MREIALDTETTGLSPKNGDRVVEIGCVELINHMPTGRTYQTYLNPQKMMDPSAEEVHGLSNDFLKDQPLFKEIVADFLEFISDSPLIIHNAEFDIGFLNHELKLAKLDLKIEDHVSKITDTLSIAREKHPGQRNSLEVLTDRYQITGYDRSYHGALIDSEILADVYLAMTGGQRDLGFDENTSRELQSNSSDSASNDFNLVSIEISKDDADKHEIYLNSLRTDSHGNN